MTLTIPKAVFASAGARDHYQFPLALAERDLLSKFVTDAYFPADRAWFRQTLGRLFGPILVGKRFHPGIASSRVSIAPGTYLYSGMNAIRCTPAWNERKDRSIGEWARRLAFRSHLPLISHSYYAYDAFNSGPGRPEVRILVQIHPHPFSVRKILEDELERTPEAANSLLREDEMQPATRRFERLCAEPQLANGWIVASSFTKRTLAEHGIPHEQIHVAPYGVDITAFPPRPSEPRDPSSPFTVIFLGSMIQRKGLSYLLQAIRLLRSRHVRLILCGRGFVDQALLDSFKDLQPEVWIGLSHAELVVHLHQADLFVLPSLVEGFGHVILEAMATGLPVITTPNTGGPDVISDGIEGFIVPIRSSTAIAGKLAWAIDNPQELAELGVRAAKRAEQQTWEVYRRAAFEAYRNSLGRMSDQGIG